MSSSRFWQQYGEENTGAVVPPVLDRWVQLTLELLLGLIGFVREWCVEGFKSYRHGKGADVELAFPEADVHYRPLRV